MESKNSSTAEELLRIGDLRTPLVISLNSFEGARYLDLRRHYYDRVTKTTKPTPKGIALKEEEFSKVLEFLMERQLEIGKMFTTDLAAAELASRSTHKEKTARKAASQKSVPLKIEFCDWPGPHFFKVELVDGSCRIQLNTRFAFVKNFSKSNNANSEGLAEILYAFHRAKDAVSGSPRMKNELLLEYLEVEWGNSIK
jgi:hypothetical protein